MNTTPDNDNRTGNPAVFEDKTLWIIGMVTAVVLIITELLFFFPKGISDTAPFILTDLAGLIESMRNFAERFYIRTIAYIALLAVFSKYLQNLGMDAVRKAIFLIMAIFGLSLIPELYGKMTGTYDYQFGESVTLNNIISAILYVVRMIAQMYIAAALLNYSVFKDVWIKRLAVTMIIIVGMPLIDTVFFLPYLNHTLFDIDFQDWYGISEYDIIVPVNKISAIFRSVFTIVLYFLFFRIFLNEKEKIHS